MASWERTILHSDLNCFFASVEIALNPNLRNKPVAVCGSQEDRHGIVLAKSEPAKRAGIKTGMANWQAQRVCPGLIIVHPHFEQYQRYSHLVRDIYARYTDQIEPFGLDECWLDVTASQLIGGDGPAIAETIRQTIKNELHLTVSIGVSFNKIFAKLGSDMKKPDAITVLSPDNYQQRVWPLPVSDLLYVGRATTAKLFRYGIRTIGDLARVPQSFMQNLMGKNGDMLWKYANGLDTSRVMPMNYKTPLKSVSHGTTCTSDLHSDIEVWRLMLHLMQRVGHKLLQQQLCAQGVTLTIRDNNLRFYNYRASLDDVTQSVGTLAQACWHLFQREYNWPAPVRSVTVGASRLSSALLPRQLTLFNDEQKEADPTALTYLPDLRREKAERAVEAVRERFGKTSLRAASLLEELPLPKTPNESRLPGQMYV